MSDPPSICTSSPRTSVRRRAKRAIVRILAGVGALWIAFHGLVWVAVASRSYWSTETAAASFPSPDGKFKAVVFVSIGGGPATSYCATSVYVVPATYRDANIATLKKRVYSAACGGMAEGHWQENITWRSLRLLEIAFDPTAGAAEGGLEIRSDAIGGKVGIKFSFQQQAGSSW